MDNKWSLFQKFLITESVQISVEEFLLNSLIAIVLSLLIQFTYLKCANSISNRKIFANNFMLIIFTTMLIISIVKSSLALSLGLVGALSIVRFRAAIKEPEELTYLFFAISIGLGLGANQQIIVLIAFVIMSAILWVRHFFSYKSQSQNLFITISGSPGQNLNLSKISGVFSRYFKKFEMKRFDENDDIFEVSYLLDVKDLQKLDSLKNDLRDQFGTLKITFVDNKSY